MLNLNFHRCGRHFLQIPGPSPVPERILRAFSLPTIDHRGPEFAALGLKVLTGLQAVFKTRHPIIIYPASGTGAWEAALSNTMSPGDHVLMFETGHFASLWAKMAIRLHLNAEVIVADGEDQHFPRAPNWRQGVQADLIEQRLRQDTERKIKAVCVVHNETSTGVTSDIPRCARRHRCSAPSRLAHGGYHFGTRLCRLSARRVGRGCCHWWVAKRFDAASGHELQRAIVSSARNHEGRDTSALLLGMGRHSREQIRMAIGPTHRTPTCFTDYPSRLT